MVSKSNKERILRLAIEITTSDDYENQELIDAWMKVFTEVVGLVEISYVQTSCVKVVSEMPGVKNPLAKRKKGTKLLTAMGLKMGEEGFDEEPLLLRLILSICQDTNYKIRLEGAVWFKDYL